MKAENVYKKKTHNPFHTYTKSTGLKGIGADINNADACRFLSEHAHIIRITIGRTDSAQRVAAIYTEKKFFDIQDVLVKVYTRIFHLYQDSRKENLFEENFYNHIDTKGVGI